MIEMRRAQLSFGDGLIAGKSMICANRGWRMPMRCWRTNS